MMANLAKDLGPALPILVFIFVFLWCVAGISVAIANDGGKGYLSERGIWLGELPLPLLVLIWPWAFTKKKNSLPFDDVRVEEYRHFMFENFGIDIRAERPRSFTIDNTTEDLPTI